MSLKKKDNNSKEKVKRRGTIRDLTSSSKKTVKDISGTTVDMVTGIPNLPWRKLPITGWLCIIGILLFMIALFIFVVPMTSV